MFDLAEGVTVSKAVFSDSPVSDYESITRAASIKRTVGVGRRYSKRTLQNKRTHSISMDQLPMYQPRDMNSDIQIPVYLPITQPTKSGKPQTTYVLPPNSITIPPNPKPNIINSRPKTFHEEPAILLPRVFPHAHYPQNMTHKRFLSTPTLPSVKVLNLGKSSDQAYNNIVPRTPGSIYTPSLLNPGHIRSKSRSRLSKIEERAGEQESAVDMDAVEDEDMSQSLVSPFITSQRYMHVLYQPSYNRAIKDDRIDRDYRS